MAIKLHSPTYISGGDTTASITGAWIDTLPFDTIGFQVSVPANGTGSWGTLYIDGTNDPSQSNVQTCPASATNDANGTPALAQSTSIAGTSAQKFMLTTPYAGYALPRFVRLRYDRSSNGAAGQLDVFVVAR
jgi:hypothetical protein